MNKQTLTVWFVTFILSVSFAWAQQDHVKKADQAFELHRYYDAIAKYKKAYTKVKDKAEKARIKFMTAECYRLMNDNKQAESWYERVIKTNYPDPIVYLYYADALKANGKYDEAVIQYNIYKEKVPDDPRGQRGVESCTLAQKWKENPTRYVVENERSFNSREDDFSPAYAHRRFRTIFFTSSRDESKGKGTDAWTGQSFSDIYSVSRDRKGAWSDPEPLPEPINTEVNEGAPSLDERANTMYFTRCPQAKNKKLGCRIHVADKRGRSWSEPEKLSLAADSFTVGHPALSPDELTLYFASNMPGGHGGRDIWKITREKSRKPFDGEPVNLGPVINTPGDEMYPYVRQDGVLFFSSDGHIGMGGLDIFMTKKEDGQWSEPENMKYPINSANDDFGIIFEGEEEKGYLSSNRTGSRSEGGKSRGGVDIWNFYLPPLIFSLQGTITDDSTGEQLQGAIVEIVGSDGSSYVDTTNEDGFYNFSKKQIQPNTTYEITFSKEGYFTKKGEESTVGLERSKALVYDETLALIPDKGIELPEILYDLARWELKPQYTSALDGLIKTMEANPNIVIELGSHTDTRPIPMTNKVLSQKRAESVVNYLISKGIAGDRLVAKGYGATKPKVLQKDVVRDGVKFEAGTKLDRAYINSLKTTRQREAAHQLNRRTEFKVLRTDYVPSEGGNIEAPEIQIIDDEEGGTQEEMDIQEEQKAPQEGDN